ncbi:MAG: hypothetical protein QXD94_05740 [Sulfolobales archaeon]
MRSVTASGRAYLINDDVSSLALKNMYTPMGFPIGSAVLSVLVARTLNTVSGMASVLRPSLPIVHHHHQVGYAGYLIQYCRSY